MPNRNNRMKTLEVSQTRRCEKLSCLHVPKGKRDPPVYWRQDYQQYSSADLVEPSKHLHCPEIT